MPPGLVATHDQHSAAPIPELVAVVQFVVGAVELERAVPPSGNVAVGGQQFWFGPHRAGGVITFWVDSTTVHLSSNGRFLKTVPSRLNERDVARLARAGARAAWRHRHGDRSISTGESS